MPVTAKNWRGLHLLYRKSHVTPNFWQTLKYISVWFFSYRRPDKQEPFYITFYWSLRELIFLCFTVWSEIIHTQASLEKLLFLFYLVPSHTRHWTPLLQMPLGLFSAFDHYLTKLQPQYIPRISTVWNIRSKINSSMISKVKMIAPTYTIGNTKLAYENGKIIIF